MFTIYTNLYPVWLISFFYYSVWVYKITASKETEQTIIVTNTGEIIIDL